MQCEGFGRIASEYLLKICNRANRCRDFPQALRRLDVGQVKHSHHIIAATWHPVFVRDRILALLISTQPLLHGLYAEHWDLRVHRLDRVADHGEAVFGASIDPGREGREKTAW